MKAVQGLKAVAIELLALGLIGSPAFCAAADEPAIRGGAAPDSALYLKVHLSKPVGMSRLKPGNVVEGTLARDVYSADRELFPAGSRVRLTVDRVEKRRRPPNDHWPWVIEVFSPRHESYPVFRTATVSQSERESALQVSLISVSRRREVHAQAKKKKPGGQAGGEDGTVEVSKPNGREPAAPTMVLEAFASGDSGLASEAGSSAERVSPRPETLPAGTQCKILLLGDISASKSKPGDVVRARLLEPVSLNSRVILPAGSLFEGKVVKKTPPRWGSRAGTLSLTFTGLTLPGGNLVPIAASLAGAELDRGSHTRIDAEGQLRGERPGKAWMAINMGVTAGITKEVDDGAQLVIEALVSTATDASTAGTARIAASCISGIFMVTRHGRDVILPRFTEMEISLDRPLSVNAAAQVVSAGFAGGR